MRGNSSKIRFNTRACIEPLEWRRMLSIVPAPLASSSHAQEPEITAAAAAEAWQPVPAADFSQISLSQFSDAELQYVKPLFWFSTVANAVVENATGSLPRGFINIKVWRWPQDNHQHNARVLENHVAFAYFYSQNRSWNPYFGNVQVKNRLEAILDLWAGMQNSSGGNNDGTWTEYSATNWSLAPTGFGMRSMMRTLELLEGGPAIEAGVKQRVTDAMIRGLRAMLATNRWLNIGIEWTNQYAPVFGTALRFAEMFPQYRDELLGYLRLRVPESVTKHTSPAKYLYESSGPDFDYTLRVHQIMISSSWHLIRGTEFEDDLVDQYTRMYDWQSYNLVRQPNGAGYLTNNALTTRTDQKMYTTIAFPMSEHVTNGRFLASTAAEDTAVLTNLRSDLSANWGNWGALPTNTERSYPPGPFQDEDRVGWRPTEAQRNESISALPYLASSRFIQQFVDTRRPVQFTFVRRPTYYAALNTGQIIQSQQRYGLGLLWHPSFGAVLQDQVNTDVSAWGTKASSATKVYEGSTINTTFNLNGQNFTPVAGSNRLSDGTLRATYVLGSAGNKSITFDEDTIRVAINHTGAFTETIPLLKRAGETIEVTLGRISLTRGGTRFVITFPTSVSVTRNTPGISPGDGLSVENFVLSSSGSLAYAMHFEPATVIAVNGDRNPSNLNDTFRIVRSNNIARIFLNDSLAPEAEWDVTSPSPTLTLNGLSGDDTFIIDLTGGNPLPPTDLAFDGGAGSGNRVTVISGATGASVTAGGGRIRVGFGAANYTSVQALAQNLGAGRDTLTLAGSLPSGGFDLTVSTGGTLVLAGGSLPTNAAAEVIGTLDLNGFGAAFQRLSGAGIITNSSPTSSATLTVGGLGSSSTFAGSIRDGASAISFTKTGIGVFTLAGDNIYSGSTTVTAGTLLITQSFRTSSSLSLTGLARVALTPRNDHVKTLQIGTLSLGSSSTLDLADNDLVVNSGNFSTLRAAVINGFGSAGPGITSSTSDGSAILALFDNALVGATHWNGGTISGTAIVGKYTYSGDANLDGQVTGDDYTVVDANLNTTPPEGLGWLSGDMNWDGTVTGDDYTVIDANLGLGAGDPLTPASIQPQVPSTELETAPEYPGRVASGRPSRRGYLRGMPTRRP